ncbi:MAG: hypothetical protein U0790_28775 [Isosphaeraceae bacterium]
MPHVGGVLMQPGEPYYEAIRSWVADGARLDLTTPRVTRIEVFPVGRSSGGGGPAAAPRAGDGRGGEVRDVTREAFLETGNQEVAVANKSGLMTALRRGEAPVLARFEGAYASTTLTVMGDRGAGSSGRSRHDLRSGSTSWSRPSGGG